MAIRYFAAAGMFMTIGGLSGVEVRAQGAAVPGGRLEIERTTGFFTSEGESLFYEVHGDGPAVIFNHGYGGSHAVWYQQVSSLASAYRVVTWDARGFGRSTNHEGAAGPESSVRDLAALMNHLEIERAHVVGQSMGGWTAMGFALEHPDRAISVTLADTIAGLYTPATRAAFDAFNAKRRARKPGEFLLGGHPALGGDLVQRDSAQALLYQELGSLAPPAPRSIPAALRATAYDHDKVGALHMPFLFIVGAEDQIFPPDAIRDAIRDASRLVANAQVSVISAAGHSPYFEQPRAWNDVFARFLTSTSK